MICFWIAKQMFFRNNPADFDGAKADNAEHRLDAPHFLSDA